MYLCIFWEASFDGMWHVQNVVNGEVVFLFFYSHIVFSDMVW